VWTRSVSNMRRKNVTSHTGKIFSIDLVQVCSFYMTILLRQILCDLITVQLGNG